MYFQFVRIANYADGLIGWPAKTLDCSLSNSEWQSIRCVRFVDVKNLLRNNHLLHSGKLRAYLFARCINKFE